MALLDALIDKVSDPALRRALRDQIDTMLIKQSFGLVYQQHKPETVELPNYRVRRGCQVRVVAEDSDDLYLVEQVRGDMITIASNAEEPERWEIDRGEVVVVREFGEPIYPGLRPVGHVDAGGEKPPHIVIMARISTR